MSDKVTAPRLVQMRQKGEKIVCVTAYDFSSAQLAEEAGIDMVLVGDSLGNVIQGHSTTLPVELEDIGYHTRAVARGLSRPLLVADLPFGSYNISVEQAVESSIYLMKCNAEAVKLEGAYTDEIRAIVKAGIPVMGHVGFTPQSVNNFGGFRVQGKGEHAEEVLTMAKQIEDAGAFGIVLELIPGELAERITEALSIPTIGIGAGENCSGQVQVWHDVLGLAERQYKHAKFYMQGRVQMIEALKTYTQEVKQGEFPTGENTF